MNSTYFFCLNRIQLSKFCMLFLICRYCNQFHNYSNDVYIHKFLRGRNSIFLSLIVKILKGRMCKHIFVNRFCNCLNKDSIYALRSNILFYNSCMNFVFYNFFINILRSQCGVSFATLEIRNKTQN